MVPALRRCGFLLGLYLACGVLLMLGGIGAEGDTPQTQSTPNSNPNPNPSRINKQPPTATQEGLGSWSATVYVDDAVDGGRLVVKEGVLDEREGVATAIFDTTGRATSGWAELVLRRGLSPMISEDPRLMYRAFGLLEGMLTCVDIGPFRLNAMHALFPPPIPIRDDDNTQHQHQPVSETVLSFLRANEVYVRHMVAQQQHTHTHWRAVGDVLAQFDGLVEGYARSRCFENTPLDSMDLWLLQSYGDLFDLLPALSSLGPMARQHTHNTQTQTQNTQEERWRPQPQPSPPRLRPSNFNFNNNFNYTETPRLRPSLPPTNTNTAEMTMRRDVANSSRPTSRKGRHRCTAAVLLTENDIVFGHTTWDAYSLLWPRIYKTIHLAPNVWQSFSSSPSLLSSLDDFYLIHGSLSHPSSRLALVESSYEMLHPRRFAPLLSPMTLPCWVRIMVANARARDGKEWGQVFGTENSGTYNTNWLVLDMNRVGEEREGREGFVSVREGFATIVETMPGHVAMEDVTSVLQDKRVLGLYNVPYTQSVRDLYGYIEAAKQEPHEFDYWQVPRARQLSSLAKRALHMHKHKEKQKDKDNDKEKEKEEEKDKENDKQKEEEKDKDKDKQKEREKDNDMHKEEGFGGLEGMAWMLGYNDPMDAFSNGHAMDAISARGDLEDVIDYWEGGALDAKASSYRSAFLPSIDHSTTTATAAPLILGRVGPSADQRPVFCWDQRGSLALRRMSHESHPDCYTFHWAPIGNTAWPMQGWGAEAIEGLTDSEVPAFWN